MVAIRYFLPALLVVLALVMIAIEPNDIGLEGAAMMVGAALAVLLLNVLFRAGVAGDRERAAEEQAREEFYRTGRWPDGS